MNRYERTARLLPAVTVLLAVVSPVFAEDVEKRFRVAFAAGFHHTQDEERSDSANFLNLFEPDGDVVASYEEPRNDTAAIGTLGIEPAYRATASLQYAFTKIFVLEGSIGYQKGDVGKVEAQAQFDDEFFDTTRFRFNFRVFPLNAGELTEIPLQLTALARFRPKAVLNPYIGAGIGYTFIGFEPSDELNDLSSRMDASIGEWATLETFPGILRVDPSVAPRNLSGVTIDARDSFEWHLAGGLEVGFKKRWSAFLDARYTFASGAFRIGFDSGRDFGVSVPNGAFEIDSAVGRTRYGTYHLASGLFDGGCLVQIPEEIPVLSPGEAIVASCGDPSFCQANPEQCAYLPLGTIEVPNPVDPTGQPLRVTLPQSDGVPDAGLYYVKGGEIKYGGLAIQIGIRYTY